MSRASGSSGSGGRPTSRPAEEIQSESYHRLLELVLQETIDRADPEEIDALLQVARRHTDEPLSAEVLEDLVATILKSGFGKPWEKLGDGDARKEMVRQIAETLLDDDGARERLESLWRRLSEAV